MEDKIFTNLTEAYNLLIAQNGQGVDKPMPRQLAGVIRVLYKKKGVDFLQQARIAARTPILPAQRVKIEGVAPNRPSRPALQETNSGQSGTTREERQRKRQGETLDTRALVVEDENIELGVGSGEEETPNIVLSTAEVSGILAMSSADIDKTYGATRLHATLLAMEIGEAALEGKTGRQLANLLKKTLQEDENDSDNA